MLSNWTNERSVLIKAKQQPNTTATIVVAKTATRDMAKLTLGRLDHSDVRRVIIEMPNGSQVVIQDGQRV